MWVSLGVAALAFYAALGALGPDSLALPLFNSDSAVPVLMSNETHWDVFHAFYLGQDRFGAWPFFLAHALSALLHCAVTPEFLHLQATLFLLAGALPAALLFRPFPGLAVLAYTAAVLAPLSRGSLFEIAQLYPWQLPLLFWAWWGIRASWRTALGWPLFFWLSLSALLCFLATWTSTLSGPLLFAVTLLEGLDGRAALARTRWRWALQLLPSLVGVAGEAALRAAYHRFVRATYLRDFRTGLRLDWGHFQENTRALWLGLEQPLVLGTFGVLAAYAAFLFAERRRARGHRPPWGGLGLTVLGAFLVGVLPLPVLVAVRHVRLNEFAPRYFAPTYVFLLFGGLLALSSVVPERAKGRTRGVALLLGTLGLSAVVLVLVPRAASNPEYARQQRTARTLAERAPGAFLLDGYWGTYVFAALAPPGALRPLPSSGEWNRLPAYESALPLATEVVVGHRGLLPSAEGSAPLWLFQYGTLLERLRPSLLSDGVDAFSLYQPRGVEALPFTAEPPLAGLDLEPDGAEVRVAAGAAQGEAVLAVGLSCLSVGPPPRGEQEDAQGRRTPLEVERVPGAVFFTSPGDVGPRTLHLHFGRERCRLRDARWFERAGAQRQQR